MSSGMSSFLGLTTVILAMSGTTMANTASGGSVTSIGSFCTPYFCVTTTYSQSTSTLAYNLTTTTSGSWFAVGTGSRMAGATMWLNWADNGKVVMSERTATGHFPPSISSNPESTFNSSSSLVAGTTFTSLWTIPATSSSITSLPMIWSYKSGSSSPGSSASASIVQQHDDFGTVTVNLATADDNNNAPVQQSKSIGSWSSSKRTKKLIVAHAVFMLIAWGIAAPFAVLLGRYGRGLFAWVLPHWITQGGVTAIFSIVGLILSIVACQYAGEASFKNAHEYEGIVLIFAMVLQITGGWYIHHNYDPNRKKRPITNFGHMALGMILLILGFVTIFSGVDRYLQGEPGDGWQKVVFWVWVGIVIVAFIGGYALIPRQLRKEREDSMQRRGDVTMHKSESPADSGNYPLQHLATSTEIRRASSARMQGNYKVGAAVPGGAAWDANDSTTHLNGADANNWTYPSNNNANRRNMI